MICSKCQYDNLQKATYCGNCGVKLSGEKSGNYNIHVRNIMYFFFAMLAYILILHFSELGSDYITLLVADGVFAIIVMVFFIMKFKDNKRLLNIRKYDKRDVELTVLLAPVASTVVFHLAGFWNQSVFDTNSGIYYQQFQESPYPFLFSVLSIALFPAIFEEIAFRGILFDESLKLFGVKPAIIFTAILFTCLHLEVIAAIWLFPLGLWFGYLRAKYNTLVYGMLAHFLYNTVIVVWEMVHQ